MQTNLSDVVSPQKARRPRSITWLTGAILLLALTSFARMSQAIVQWNFLVSLKEVSPVYILISGLFWGVFGCVTGLLLWLRWNWSRFLVPAFWFSFSLCFWVDRLFVSLSPERNINWPFILGINLLVLFWAFWAVNRPKARSYFEDVEKDTGGNSSGSEVGGLDG